MKQWWQHGFIVRSPLGWEVKSVDGLGYASKYVAKDFGYFSIPYLSNLDKNELRDFQRTYKDYMPKHWQSVGYGKYFDNYIDSADSPSIFLYENRYTICDSLFRSLPIPRYYHLRYEKYINKHYSRLLDKVVVLPTDIGRDVKRLKLDSIVSRSSDKIRLLSRDYIFNQIGSQAYFDQCFLWLSQNMTYRYIYFKSIYDSFIRSFDSFDMFRMRIVNTLTYCFLRYGADKLAKYLVFLRFMPYNDSISFDSIETIKDNILFPTSFPPEYLGVIVPPVYRPGVPLVGLPSFHLVKLVCHSSKWQDFEYFASLYELFNSIISFHKEFDSCYNDFVRKRCKHVLSPQPLTFKSFYE